MKWEIQPQEQKGTYRFSGRFLVTSGIEAELSPEEIAAIYQQVQQLVKEQNGIDYLVVFKNDKGQKLFFIDQLNKEMIESGDYANEHNYCTLLFSHEY